MEELLKAYMGFNTQYFKIGQLIKVTVRNQAGQFLEENYGFIKYFDKDEIIFYYIDKDGEEKQSTIVPIDLTQKELDIKIEIIR